jgi:hypothetical protein
MRRHVVRCLHGLGFCLMLVWFSSCADASYWVGRTFYGVDCSPEAVETNNGKCVYVKKGTASAQASRP